MLAPDRSIEEPDMRQRKFGHRPKNSLLREFIAVLTLLLPIVLLVSNFSTTKAQENKNPLAGNAKAMYLNDISPPSNGSMGELVE